MKAVSNKRRKKQATANFWKAKYEAEVAAHAATKRRLQELDEWEPRAEMERQDAYR